MKKILVAVLVLSVLVALPAFAEETKEKQVTVTSMGMSMGMPKEGMEKMCRSMMGKAQMVATDEGGVIVLAGNKLMKYDADLNLVKEVEIKMPALMGGKQGPMMGKMAEKGSAPAAPESQEKTV